MNSLKFELRSVYGNICVSDLCILLFQGGAGGNRGGGGGEYLPSVRSHIQCREVKL